MNLLVDTHALIWFITDHNNLPSPTKALMESKENECFVSIACFWELGIKFSIGRLELHTDLENIFKLIEESGFNVLPLTPNHILKSASLEFHHQDPFDRIIIAQSLVENMPLITRDEQFKKYSAPIIWQK